MDGLRRVDLHVVTYGLRSAGELELALLDDRGAEIARERVPAAELPDRAWIALELPPQPASAGRAFVLRVAMRGEPRDATTLSLARSVPEKSRAVLDGEALAGSLVLRGFASWDRALAGVGEHVRASLGAPAGSTA